MYIYNGYVYNTIIFSCVCATNANVLHEQHLVTLKHRSAVGQAALCSELPGQACQVFRLCQLSVCRCYPSERNSQREAWKELRIEKICVCPCGVLFLNNPQKPTNTCRQKAAREWTMPHQSARGCKNGWRIGNHWNKHVQSDLFLTFMEIRCNTCEALASKRLLRYECFQSSSNSSVDLQGSPNSWHFCGLSLSDVRIFYK